MRVLCTGAPGAALDYLVRALREASHSVTSAAHARDAAYRVMTEGYDAVVLLAQAPLAAALQAVACLRQRPAHTSLVVIAADAGKDERIALLGAGADACLAAPYWFAELNERLLALSRLAHAPGASGTPQQQPQPLPRYSAPPDDLPGMSLQLDSQTRSVRCGARWLALPQREFLLLECLMRQPGAVVPHEVLLDHAFQDSEADRKALALAMARLRRRLRAGMARAAIASVKALGYRLILS